MLCWMCNHTLNDEIKKGTIQDKLGVVIEYKMRESRLKWFQHIQYRPKDTLVSTCEKIGVDDDRVIRGWTKGRLKKN